MPYIVYNNIKYSLVLNYHYPIQLLFVNKYIQIMDHHYFLFFCHITYLLNKKMKKLQECEGEMSMLIHRIGFITLNVKKYYRKMNNSLTLCNV